MSTRPTAAAAIAPLVLVVDDFADARELYLDYLPFHGYRVVVACDGRDALAQVLASTPDIILMDLSLPVMDGWEATRRLKADPRSRHIPVIAVTGHALDGAVEQALEAGCDRYIAKPCTPAVVLSAIQQLLSKDPAIA